MPLTSKGAVYFALLAAVLFCVPSSAYAHFGTITASPPMLDQYNRQTHLTFSFLHPFQQTGMDLKKPETVKIVSLSNLASKDLTDQLESAKILNHQAWELDYQIERPGAYCIYMHPQPYWEAAENIYIKHITKTYIGAFGQEEGWSKPIGLETEIVPLTRPFGLYAGNVFQGRVFQDGKPVAGAEVEVEYLNTGGKAATQSEYMITQVIKADENAVFTYSPPASGWWGFSALNTADYTLEHQGQQKQVELGAVIWIHFLPWQTKNK